MSPVESAIDSPEYKGPPEKWALFFEKADVVLFGSKLDILRDLLVQRELASVSALRNQPYYPSDAPFVAEIRIDPPTQGGPQPLPPIKNGGDGDVVPLPEERKHSLTRRRTQ
jgi:hypothetical protein